MIKPNHYKEFGRKLRVARKERAMTLTNLKDLTGISVSTISEIETGKTDPRWSQALTLADALGRSLKYFAGEKFAGPRMGPDLLLIKKYNSLPAEFKRKVDAEIYFLARAKIVYKK